MSNPVHRRLLFAAAAALPVALGAVVSAHAEAMWSATYASGSALLSAPCLDGTVALSVEESRLGSTLSDNTNSAVLQTTSFARQMIEGAGFEEFGPSLVNADIVAKVFLRGGTLILRPVGAAIE